MLKGLVFYRIGYFSVSIIIRNKWCAVTKVRIWDLSHASHKLQLALL